MQTLEQARGSGALGPSTLAVMGRLCGLFGLGLMEAGAGDLLEGGWLSGELDMFFGVQLCRVIVCHAVWGPVLHCPAEVG